MHSTVLYVFTRANRIRGAIGEIPYSHLVSRHVIIINSDLIPLGGDSRLQGNSKTRLSDLRDNVGTDLKC